jgi:hypothetical protein
MSTSGLPSQAIPKISALWGVSISLLATIVATIDKNLELGCYTFNILRFKELHEWSYMMIDPQQSAGEQTICHYDAVHD